ncbi:hypothetical protein HNP38_002429 [Chryseobacterium defluvii]|uniref:YhhN-like protein n=1 Tax=Chryseobacterium defluvii TaxID=160396 RepID=A0A840KEX8_9FLAO|nr:hypothetical protein [Chryseobacterium defluvii]MBB4807125.1 hypothetical protein [Chryseobacterium defluvii]
MNWNIETGKQISMMISILVMVLMIIRYRKIGKEYLFFIIGYILFSCMDILSYFYLKVTGPPTDKFYVIILFIVFLLYLLYYFRLLYLPQLKKIQLVLLAFLFINTFVRLFVENDMLKILSFNMLYVNILLLLFSIILFLYQTFNSDKILELKSYLPFWISVALLIFFIGFIPILFFRNTVSENIYFIILFMLNLISNGILILGLLWNKQEGTR